MQIGRKPASSVVGPCKIATGLNQLQGSAPPQRQPSRGTEQSPPESGQRDFEFAADVVPVLRNPSTTRSSDSRMIAEAAAERLSATTSGDHGRTSAAKRLLQAFGPNQAARHPK